MPPTVAAMSAFDKAAEPAERPSWGAKRQGLAESGRAGLELPIGKSGHSLSLEGRRLPTIPCR